MGLIGRVWAEIGGDASGLKKAAGEGKVALEQLAKAAASMGIEDASADFLKANQEMLSGLKASGGEAKKAAFSFTELNQAIEIGKKVFRGLQQAWDFASEGAQISSLKMASIGLAKTYGTSMTSIVSAVKKASFNTITEYDAMKSANLALTMGISTNAEEIGNLMEISIMRGRAFGLSAEEAFDRITRGIGRRSTKILDDLGFTADAITANKAYAESLGISTKALTNEDKVRALFNQLLEQGNYELEQQGGLVADVSTVYQSAGAAWKEFFQGVKEGAAYQFAPLIADDKQIVNINKQRAALALLTGGLDDYTAARWSEDKAAGIMPLSGGITQYIDEYQQSVRMAGLERMSEFYRINAGNISESTVATKEYNEALIIETALTSNLAEITEDYAKAVESAGGSKAKIAAATKAGEAAIATDVFGMALAGLDVEKDSGLIRDLALNFGQMTQEEYRAAEAMEWVNQAYDTGKIKANEYIELTDRVSGGLAEVMKGGSSDYYVHVWVITHGGGMATGINIASGAAEIMFRGLGHMHGGVVYGGQHGMVVPPGFGNDGMPVMVSSGERLDVTPAGNKTIDNTDMLSKLDNIEYLLENFPRAIRDAVQML